MAVDYTKVFTVWGKYADKVNDYYAYIATHTSDQTAVESALSSQSLVRMADDLQETFDRFKGDVSQWCSSLNSRIENVLLDESLVVSQFAIGSSPSLTQLWPVLIHDMVVNDINVTASVATIGAVSYDTTNSSVGILATGSLLDGVNPPIAGAVAVLDYAGLTTQMTPTSETLVFECIQDSETGTQRGGELFQVAGTGTGSDPFSPNGENSGTLGTIQAADVYTSRYATNLSFDSWTADEPDSWTIDAGTGGTDFEAAGAGNTLYEVGDALVTIQSNSSFLISQQLSSTTFERRRAYFVSCWARKSTDVASDQTLYLVVRHYPGGSPTTLKSVTVNPSTTTWTHYSGQFVMPAEIGDQLDLVLLSLGNAPANDPVIVDQIVITPCSYYAGAAFMVTGGPEKWLVGDKATLTLSNNNAGVFQTHARKAFRVQLPVDGTPTISDSLVA